MAVLVANDRLLRKLSPHARDALGRASEICIEHTAFEVTVSHMLLALLGLPGADFSCCLRSLKLPVDLLEQKIKAAFEYDRKNAQGLPVFSPLLLELLQDALVTSAAELDEDEIRTGAILIALARDPGRYCHHLYFSILSNVDANLLTNQFRALTRGSLEVSESGFSAHSASSAATGSEDATLAKYGRDLIAEAKQGHIDPVFCRDAEIGLMTEILCRRRKNNPILVGDPGVGKTALAEGVALKICAGEVPPALQGVRLWELDLGALQAGASVRGEFERRLKSVLDAAQNHGEKVVLFIDEAHTLIGAGGPAGGGDAANLLKPALARGNLRVIAATTWTEYKKYFEKDAALTRRFQLVKLAEPSPAQAVVILRGLRGAYERQHGVYISDAALQAASIMSDRYIGGRLLPDKAIDIVDTACVRVASAQNVPPAELARLRERVALLEQEASSRARDVSFGTGAEMTEEASTATAAELLDLNAAITALEDRWSREKLLVQKLLDARAAVHAAADLKASQSPEDTSEGSQSLDAKSPQAVPKETNMNTPAPPVDPREVIAEILTLRAGEPAMVPFEVSPTVISNIISDWTGVPVSAMTDDESDRLSGLGVALRTAVMGQDEAIGLIHDRLKAARLDLTRPNTPHGVFLLAGPSGVGKTETAEQIARHLYGGRQFMTVVNMSEYQEKHAVSRLIGSPPGYVGYGEGGVLTEALRQRPYSVVLLDEVEKAHPDILNLFYQVFDKGTLNDGEGREIDCSSAVFFMTSNLGSDALIQNADRLQDANQSQLVTALTPHLEQFFKPALLARIQLLVYKPLSSSTLRRIIEARLRQQAERIKAVRQVELTWDEPAVDLIESLCSHTDSGARLVDQVIERWIITSIVDETLDRMVQRAEFSTVSVSAREGGFVMSFAPEIEPS